ncbi:pseudaminic acid synthase [bacterium]|nr:pseudaminic acid synthase [bacterium]
MAQEFSVRLANENDIKKVFNLSNDDTVRQYSFNKEKIKWDDHTKWFNERIKNTNEPFFIAEDSNGNFIAQVRIDKKEETTISISITEHFRGRGLARYIIRECSQKAGFRNIIAYVKPENQASLKSFINAGYKQTGTKDGYYKLEFNQDRVYIIAEMSANHCGDMELAKKIIKKAKEIGADAVKIQTYTADTITIDCNNEEFRINDENSLWNGENLYKLYQKAYTPWEWQGELKKYADEIGIDFFSTPFDYSAVDFLESINVPLYKIASFEAIDYPLIKYAASKGKPMIISTGISSFEEIQKAIDACRSVGNNDITILKCTSAYPAKLEDMNLKTIKDMVEKFGSQGVKVGLSDHSMSIVPPVSAVVLGAKVIEKHLTLDRSLGGADSGFSLEPKEFEEMIKAVRDTEKVLGSVDYSINKKNRKFARSLYVVKDIKKGEILTKENIRSIRPSNGLLPEYYEEVLGKKAKEDIKFGTPLKLEYLEQE